MAGINQGCTARALIAALLVAQAAMVAQAAQAAPAAQAHEHGVAQLGVAVESRRVMIELDTPLDNLLGFEHAPRTDAERAKAAAAVALLRDAAALFRIDAAAGCNLARVELNSAALALGAGGPPAASAAGHADLTGTFEFRCTAGARAGFVEVSLFDAFPGLKRLDLQVATPKGQLKATLRRPSSRVALAR